MESLIGKRAYVYWNIHRDIWSISRNGSKVDGYAESLELEDVELRVRGGGHARANREGRKNVHAFAIGKLVSIDQHEPEGLSRAISYNPFKHDYFYDKNTGLPVTNLDKCFAGERILKA